MADLKIQTGLSLVATDCYIKIVHGGAEARNPIKRLKHLRAEYDTCQMTKASGTQSWLAHFINKLAPDATGFEWTVDEVHILDQNKDNTRL